EIGDQIGAITPVLFPLAAIDEDRVVVHSLAGQDVPIVEARGVAGEVPLADHGSLITGVLQFLGNVISLRIERVRQRVNAVPVAVLASQDGGAAWRADRIRAEAIRHANTTAADAIDVGSMIHPAAISGD